MNPKQIEIFKEYKYDHGWLKHTFYFFKLCTLSGFYQTLISVYLSASLTHTTWFLVKSVFLYKLVLLRSNLDAFQPQQTVGNKYRIVKENGLSLSANLTPKQSMVVTSTFHQGLFSCFIQPQQTEDIQSVYIYCVFQIHIHGKGQPLVFYIVFSKGYVLP